MAFKGWMVACSATVLLLATPTLTISVPPDHCGHDCTQAIMTALDQAGAAGGGVVTLSPRPDGSPWVVAERAPPANNHALLVGAAHANVVLELRPGVVIQARRGAFKPAACYLLLIQNATNFTVRAHGGAKIQMWREDYNDSSKYTASEDRHAVSIAGSSNVLIDGLTVDGSGGDGIIISYRKCGPSEPSCFAAQQQGEYAQSYNITVRECEFTRNRRQGMSIIGGVNLSIENTVFSNTGSDGYGTDPMAGVDVEPSERDYLRNITFRNCRAEGNTGAGFSLYLALYNISHGPVTVTFENCSVTGTGPKRPVAGRGGSTDDQVGFSFGAMYPGMQGLVLVRGGSVSRTRLPAVIISDKAVGSTPLHISGLRVEDVAYASTMCDGSSGCIEKGAYPMDAEVVPISLLWRRDQCVVLVAPPPLV
eukprot:COSAG02_NODE_6895_length_3301_cov_1.576827_4_plen_422_part_00